MHWETCAVSLSSCEKIKAKEANYSEQRGRIQKVFKGWTQFFLKCREKWQIYKNVKLLQHCPDKIVNNYLSYLYLLNLPSFTDHKFLQLKKKKKVHIPKYNMVVVPFSPCLMQPFQHYTHLLIGYILHPRPSLWSSILLPKLNSKDHF